MRWKRGQRVLVIAGLGWLRLGAPGLAAEESTAEKAIPFAALTETNRALARAVTDHHTLRREYRARQIKARERDLLFFLDHLDACSILSHQTKLIAYRAKVDADGRIWADNHAGSRGFILPIHAAPGKRIYYVVGSQSGLFEARGRGVAVVDYRVVDATTIEYSGRLFVKVDNAVLAALAQLFQRFIRGQVDKNFDHVLAQPVTLSRWAVDEPQKLRDAIHALPEVDRPKFHAFEESLR